MRFRGDLMTELFPCGKCGGRALLESTASESICTCTISCASRCGASVIEAVSHNKNGIVSVEQLSDLLQRIVSLWNDAQSLFCQEDGLVN